MRVAVGRFDFDDAFADFEDRDIERTAAEVENRDDLVLFLVQTVRQSGRGRLVDDTQDFETRDLAGVFGRLTLCVVKISRNSDYGLFDLLSRDNLRPTVSTSAAPSPRSRAGCTALPSRVNAHVAVPAFSTLIRHLFDLVRDFVVTCVP